METYGGTNMSSMNFNLGARYQIHATAALPQGKDMPVLNEEEAEWTSEPVGRCGEEKNHCHCR